MKPYISVIIASYDRVQFIYEAIQSVMNQTLSPEMYEIIVVTGFPLDSRFSTAQRIKSLHSNERNLGPKIVQALKHANGEIISLLDDDDIFLPSKLKTIADIFLNDRKVGFVHNWMSFISENGETSIKYFMEKVTKRVNSCGFYFIDPTKASFSDIRYALSLSMDFNSSSISIRKSILMGFLSTLSRITTAADDFYFYAALTSGLLLISIPNKLTGYRVHKSNVSRSYGDSVGFLSMKLNYDRKVLSDSSEILGMASSAPNLSISKAINWKISATIMEMSWLGENMSRIKLLKQIFHHLHFVGSALLTFDLTLLAYSIICLMDLKYARALYLFQFHTQI